MTSETNTPDTGLDDLLNRHFAGKVVRKDLTKLVKEGANVPVYVLEYLLGTYCASDDEEVIATGCATVKKILAENYVRPDEAEKVKSTIRERGSLKVIDKVTVTLNEKRDVYEALLANLGVKGVEVNSSHRQEVREAAGRRHLVHRHPGILLRGGPEGVAVPRSGTSSRSRCRTWTWRSCSRGGGPSPRSSGSTCCSARPAWSRPTSPSG